MNLFDLLLGRRFRASKFKILAKLAISRVAILKNQRQVRYSLAKSDVIQLLNLGHQERALLRVEQMIKEQNLIDAFVMIENYCYLLLDRVMLLKKEKECHDEVKEAISSLIFASSRCGEFPELHQIRGIFVSKFGKELATRAIELRNNCGVNPKIIQKLSVRQPSFDIRLKVLKDTASENGIVLNLEEDAPKPQDKSRGPQEIDNTLALAEVSSPDNKLCEPLKVRKYTDAASAALVAFKSAAYAATAARAAVELSRTETRGSNQDYHPFDESIIPYEDSEEKENSDSTLVFDKTYPIYYPSSESDGENLAENNERMHLKEPEMIKDKPGIDRTSASSTVSERNIPSAEHRDMNSYRSPRVPTNEIQSLTSLMEEYDSDDDVNQLPQKSPIWISLNPEDDKVEGRSNSAKMQRRNSDKQLNLQQAKLDKRPLSMRTGRVKRD
ncbi:uncharacterized protein LOC126676483 [Mercurialis annua]|uniref:uncharacterized protein LOC126676483 n=1 Tax=Mercurialis annua TaxID=3986 RepID=UPI00216097CB|nr:uncharacterized protein LOC126676483 [Mercurialis annua]